LITVAEQESTITYSDLVERVRDLQHLANPIDNPHDPRLAEILGEISREEDAAGRGMLSVVVVRKNDDIPGDGYFILAKELGRDTSDRVKCWVEELKKVHGYWGV